MCARGHHSQAWTGEQPRAVEEQLSARCVAEIGVVEIESEWAARDRDKKVVGRPERMVPQVRAPFSRPNQRWSGFGALIWVEKDLASAPKAIRAR